MNRRAECFAKCLMQFLLLLNLNQGVKCQQEKNLVTVSTDKDHKGKSAELDAIKCISPLPDGFDKSISSVNTKGNCVNLYIGFNCTGNYIVLKPGTPHHENLGEWEGFNDQVRSIGPCYEECDPHNIETLPENSKVHISMYDHGDFHGARVKIEIEGCEIVPRKLKGRASSVRIDGDYCIQLYEIWNCTGPSIQLRRGSPRHSNIAYWGQNDRTSSVSLCGYNCKRDKFIREKEIMPPTPALVTLYSEPNFNGDFKHLDLNNSGCFNISDEWEGESESIQTYGNCVNIYEESGCSRIAKNLQLLKSETNLKSKNFDRLIRSIELCSHLNRKGKDKERENTEIHSNHKIVIFLVVGVGILALGIVIGVIVFLRLRKTHKRIIEVLTSQEIQGFLKGYDSPGSTEDIALLAYSQPYDQNYEIPKAFIHIDMESTLGAGEYAIVYPGHIQVSNSSEKHNVAIKTVKPYSGVEYVRALLKEIKIMIYVGKHPRIVELVGCCTQFLYNAELFVMTELCVNGSLFKFLQNNKDYFVNCVIKGEISLELLKSVTPKRNYMNIGSDNVNFNTFHLFEWARQVSEGMEFLANMKVIHGDLATRNLLLDFNFNIKISDFGLSRQLYEYTQYVKKHQAPLPWRHLSIESLTNLQFSTESDVWAAGVTFWEIFTLGDTPYPGSVWSDSFLVSLKDGLRLPKPIYSTSDCYNLMLDCWREKPSDRITFSQLYTKFSEIVESYPKMEQMKNDDIGHERKQLEYMDLLVI